MTSISFAVGASSVYRYIVLIAQNQYLDLLTLVSGNCGVCDKDVCGTKTRNICLRRLVASVYKLLLDHDDGCLNEIRHLVCCRLYVTELFNQMQTK